MRRNGLIVLLIMVNTHLTISQSNSNGSLFEGKISEVVDENIFRSDDYFNWGGSIIKSEDGLYHLFYSRWPRASKFTGWLLFSEIARAESISPTGPWKYIETVLTGRGVGNWDAITAHNPKIKYFGGKYYLYYISSNLGDKSYTDESLMETSLQGYSHPNWKVLRPNQRTGVAVANSLNGPWSRFDSPLIQPSGPVSTLTVNPAIDLGKNGKYYLIVKGDKPNDTNFTRNQAIAISNSPVGPFVMQPQPVINDMDTEDMSLWYDQTREKFFAIFHAHTFIGLLSSVDGINWKKRRKL